MDTLPTLDGGATFLAGLDDVPPASIHTGRPESEGEYPSADGRRGTSRENVTII